MQRPDEREFLKSVLDDLDELPDGFAERFLSLLDSPPEDRSDAIRRLIEDSAGG